MTQPGKKYQLEKAIWTTADFDDMNWHDCPVHAISFTSNFEILLDIDYIFKWVLRSKKYYSFWIAPCTLIFENVYDLVFDIGPSIPGFDIDFITRDNPQKPKNSEYINCDVEYDWGIELHQGLISFKSTGFKQYVRQQPKFLPVQKIVLEKRGGLSFDRKSIELANH